jgi:tetratricopeptide (TPR) repeat protein
VELQIALGNFAEARRVANAHLADLGESSLPRLSLYELDYLEGNRKDMAEQASHLRGTPQDLDRAAMDLQIALYEGRFAAADAAMPALLQEAQLRGRAEYGQARLAAFLLIRAEAGFTRDTLARANELLASKLSDDTTLVLAFALALSGEDARARALFASVWPRLQNAPSVAQVVKPCFDALFALRDGHPARAVDALKVSEPMEDRFKEGPVASDLRGRALLAAGDGKDAELAFRKRLDHPGLDPLNIQHVVAHLNVGRAKAVQGDRDGARKAYEQFFALWKNADPDIPLLRQARAEYAKLTASVVSSQ